MINPPDGYSEYDGKGVMPNTVHPKDTEALTASDQLRLQSITGQEEDSRAPVDPYHWQGNARPDGVEEKKARLLREAREQAIVRAERDRYRETRLSQY